MRDLYRNSGGRRTPPPVDLRLHYTVDAGNQQPKRRLSDANGNEIQAGLGTGPQLSNARPGQLLIPVLSRRKPDRYESVVDRERGSTVANNDRNLTARLASLDPDHEEGQLYRLLLGEVLDDVRVGVFLSQHGQQPGTSISSSEGIELERMGEGVSGALTIISELATPGPYVFLVEEPENDLHPTALRRLLDIMVDATREHKCQFIVSTHSDIVLRTLGAVEGAVVYETKLDTHRGRVPRSTYTQLTDAIDRRRALAELGYEVTGASGWLFFEESTAQTFVTTVLIPAFAPKLTGLKPVSSRGVTNLPAYVADFHRVVLYAHLSDKDVHRAWVIVDGDKVGRDVVRKLRDDFKTWPEERFISLSKPDVEDYYPSRFADKVAEIKSAPKSDWKELAALRGELVREVCSWYYREPEKAREELAVSAADLIQVLQAIERDVPALFE